MRITKSDLEYEVRKLNDKYCRNTKNKLAVNYAYGGTQVVLTGKRYKNGKGWRGIGSGQADITYGHDTARNTLSALYQAEAKGWLKNSIKHYEKRW